MTISTTKKAYTRELQKQLSYVEQLDAKGFNYGFAVGSAFVESMRNSYYESTGTALDEIVDNAIEARASNIHIALGYSKESDAKPNALAIIDDGHGMEPLMIRQAVRWGGTHRENSREGFGRFGFGLPSASVNQCRRFSVFSKVEGGKWQGLVIDLDEIKAGKYNDKSGQVVVPPVSAVAPPQWLLSYLENDFSRRSFEHGTIVLWEKLDRLTWKTTTGLRKNLLDHFGVVYRNYLGQVSLVFDGTRVEPTDPLFTTPGYRFYDLDEDRAEALPGAEFDIALKETDQKARVGVRYAFFPLKFFAIDKSGTASGKNQNARFKIKNDSRGLILTRMGRQLTVLEHTPWKGLEKFRNDDRHWAVEIDVPAELDEELAVSNTKQSVVVSERFWDLLEKNGVAAAIRSLRTRHKDAVKAESSKEDKSSEPRMSERSMQEAEKFRRKKVNPPPVEREKKAKEKLEQYVRLKAKEERKDETVVRAEFENEAAKHPYKVAFEDLVGAPFFRVEQIGGLRVLFVNRAHRFFSDVYAAPGSTRVHRAGLEILMFSIGEAELDAQGNPDKSLFYTVERKAWSEILATGLEVLDRYVHDTEVTQDDDDADADATTEAA